MPPDVIARARAGDAEAFQELVEPYRRELHVHCYRLLGSFQDAEDALQDVLLTAWRGIASFEGRASVRTWLYRIATNRCLDVLRSARRRPAVEWGMPEIQPPQPSRLGEVVWLEPYPNTLLGDLLSTAGSASALDRQISVQPTPETRYEQTEAISLAFVTALQLLPPRQRAVLILRDVLGYHASEVAVMLETSVESVTSALKRARTALHRRMPASDADPPPPAPNSAAERALVDRFVRAYEAADIDALVALLTHDVILSMPPIPLEYHGRDAVARFLTTLMGATRRYELVATRANGQLAFGAYVRSRSSPIRHAAGLLVLTLRGEQVSALTRFDNNTLPWFSLPPSLHS
jgi:RNA polymerase sigma-70 factor (TIGR02960 family)